MSAPTTKLLCKKEILKVRVKPFKPFIISGVEKDGVIGIIGFECGKKRPRRGKHYLLSSEVREAWLSRMELVK